MLGAGQVIQERYELQELLAQNVARQTWLALDLNSTDDANKFVVLKLLAFAAPTQWDELKLFEREAQVLKNLNHPHIPKYYDYFPIQLEQTNWNVLVQEYIAGRSLKQLLTEGKHFSETEVSAIATDVLDILIYLHELSPPLVHRDIKPSNLILGNHQQVYLVDFGAVQDRVTAEGATLTVVGTYGYAAPEQMQGRTIPASDLYGLGTTLIHLLTGTAPNLLPQRDLRIQFSDRLSVSPHLVRWITILAEPAAEQRFKTARQARQALQTPLAIPPSRQIRQPAGSRVQLTKSLNQLKIRIPYLRVNFENFGAIFFSLLTPILATIYLFLIPARGWLILFFFLFILGFWAYGIFMLSKTLLPLAPNSIQFNSDHFVITWQIAGITYRREGQTSNIHDIVDTDFIIYKFRNRWGGENVWRLHEAIALHAGVKTYRFAAGLTKIEREWLTEEIRDWLNL